MKSTTIEILLLLLAAFSSCSVMQRPQDATDKEGPFYYDWETLRIGGLVFAGVTCFLGIVILISGKCKCKFNKKKSSPVSVAPKARSDSTDC
ncbi:FXYD domain-containing ion transport regulator 3-like [Tiliqua scincoides]|uniref:FXYD domain-containing ion transport regulator 3-like n=1 Tax=Tiliqua scincoides TaxID=71010 RepID=UPI0034637D7B